VNEWQRHMHQHQADQRWQALVDKLQEVWGADFERRGAAARRMLDAFGPAHLQKLQHVPLSTMVELAKAYSAVALRESPMTPAELRIGAELLVDQTSEYWQKPQDPELAAGARVLVSELMEAAAGGKLPADPAEPLVQETPEPTVEAKEQATKLMASKSYWDKGNLDYAATHRQVQQLLEGAAPPPTTGALDRATALSRAREIMADRNGPYHQGSHPNHDAARAEVSALFQQAYPEPPAPAEEGT
jgi:hypothetical protein